MGWLGNSPEKRKYNKAILLFAICGIPLFCGFLLNSLFLTILGFVVLFICSPIILIAKEEYYSFLWKKIRKKLDVMTGKSKGTPHESLQQKIEEKKEIKEPPLFPVILGSVITLVFGYLYIVHRHEEIYPLIFMNVAIIGITVLIYGIFKALRG
ncbi:hypothetical protein KAX97_09100 [candidate division WOR-3 bacterium]|nr:hypothetical protein [candidate division WOR-3 bacterium]